MIYLWNITAWVGQMIPRFLNKGNLYLFVKDLLVPLETVYQEFLEYRIAIDKTLQYNGQTIILENLLNDIFDSTLRRIRIINQIHDEEGLFIARAAENQIVYIGRKIDNEPTYIGRYNENSIIAYDFIVLVDGHLSPELEVRLKSIVNYYKMAGTSPLFKYTDEIIF